MGTTSEKEITLFGTKVKETIFSVDAFDTETMQIKTFLRDECEFGYRESIFKKNKNLIVVSATFELTASGAPNIDYEDVKKYFYEHIINTPSLIKIH